MNYLHFALMLTLAALTPGRAEDEPLLIIHPSPGDLSTVEGLEESPLFDLSVNGRDTFVYRGFELEFNKYGFARKGGSYVSFAFAHAEAVVEITTARPITSFSIKPLVRKVEQTSPTTLRITLDQPAKFLLTAELEELGENWFIISAEAPPEEKIDPDDPTVLSLGPGVHDFGRAWDPFVDGIKTLHLSGGAVVTATLHCVGKDGIRIIGNGLFAQAFRPHARREDPLQAEWFGDAMGAFFRDCRNLRFEGYAVINSPSYQLEVANCDDIVIRNLKLLGFGENNNDGVHLYSRNVLLEDCFIAGSDDRVCITGLYDSEDREVKTLEDQTQRITGTIVRDIHVRDTIFWGQKNGGDIMLTWNGAQTCDNVLIEDCESIGATNKGFLASKHGGSVFVTNVTIRNIRIHHDRFLSLEINPAGVWGAGGGGVRNLLLENIRINADPADVGIRILGLNDVGSFANLIFRQVTMNGVLLQGFGQTDIETNPFIRNVIFE
ncbi:MAG: glycosyl hydrolase family 28 protein [Opitutaceae bacterium]